MLHSRLDAIRRLLSENPRRPVSELQRELGVSRATVRRDLLRLEASGEVLRVHGGALHPASIRGEASFDRRLAENRAAKRAIGVRASQLVKPGASVFIDAGTTCLEVGTQLLARADVRIYTNSLRLLAAADGGEAELIAIGGQVRRPGESLVGGFALAWCRNLRFDMAFIGASGIDEGGASTTELSEAAVKQAAVERAESAVLVADTSKADRPAAVRTVGWSSLRAWVCDRAPAAPTAAAAQQAGTALVTAGRGRR